VLHENGVSWSAADTALLGPEWQLCEVGPNIRRSGYDHIGDIVLVQRSATLANIPAGRRGPSTQ